jgi:hypothetical protein
MIGSGGRMANWSVVGVLCLLAAGVAACGHNGSAGVIFPGPGQQSTPLLTGVIEAPNGQFAAADRWGRWMDGLHLLAKAYALSGVSPVTTQERVTLVRVDATEAAHGSTLHAKPLAFVSTQDGRYEFVDASLAADLNDLSGCPTLMVQVGDPTTGTLTRAFAFTFETNINWLSEALVQVILDTLVDHTPPVQLCDFNSEEMQNIYNVAYSISGGVTGESVVDINQNAIARLRGSQSVSNAIEAAIAH